jgi:riboflavin-specific deaminase-like protein
VVINMSMSADGKIASANRAVESFSSRRDQEALLALRATADAVMCGAGTAGTAGVTLGPGGAKYRRRRLRRGLAEHNLRVVVSGAGRVEPGAEVFQRRFSPIVVLTTTRASARRVRRLRQVADEVVAFGREELDLAAALRWLHQRWRVRRVICEGGGELNDAMFRAGLVDELRLTVCPCIIGGRTAPTIADGRGSDRLADATDLQLISARQAGDEMFLVFTRSPARRA